MSFETLGWAARETMSQFNLRDELWQRTAIVEATVEWVRVGPPVEKRVKGTWGLLVTHSYSKLLETGTRLTLLYQWAPEPQMVVMPGYVPSPQIEPRPQVGQRFLLGVTREVNMEAYVREFERMVKKKQPGSPIRTFNGWRLNSFAVGKFEVPMNLDTPRGQEVKHYLPKYLAFLALQEHGDSKDHKKLTTTCQEWVKNRAEPFQIRRLALDWLVDELKRGNRSGMASLVYALTDPDPRLQGAALTGCHNILTQNRGDGQGGVEFNAALDAWIHSEIRHALKQYLIDHSKDPAENSLLQFSRYVEALGRQDEQAVELYQDVAFPTLDP